MKHTYFLINQYNEIIYIGITNDIARRYKEHLRGAKNVKSKKRLYKKCRELDYTFTILKDKTFDCVSTAKLYEAYLILKEIIDNKNVKILNGQIDKCRIFDRNITYFNSIV